MEKVEKVPYKVSFTYYQYNSGAADNGTYKWYEKFDTEKKAKQFKRIIDAAYEAYRNDEFESYVCEWGCKYVGDISGYGGFINSTAKITIELKTIIEIES